MTSLYDELSEKLKKDPRLTKNSLARADLGLLLFNAREALRELWIAADDEIAAAAREGRPAPAALAGAVEKLRQVFGDRTTLPSSSAASSPRKGAFR